MDPQPLKEASLGVLKFWRRGEDYLVNMANIRELQAAHQDGTRLRFIAGRPRAKLDANWKQSAVRKDAPPTIPDLPVLVYGAGNNQVLVDVLTENPLYQVGKATLDQIGPFAGTYTGELKLPKDDWTEGGHTGKASEWLSYVIEVDSTSAMQMLFCYELVRQGVAPEQFFDQHLNSLQLSPIVLDVTRKLLHLPEDVFIEYLGLQVPIDTRELAMIANSIQRFVFDTQVKKRTVNQSYFNNWW